MSANDPALFERAEELGVETWYHDVHGTRHEADPAALAAVVDLLADDARASRSVVEPVVVVPPRRDERAGDRGAPTSIDVPIDVPIDVAAGVGDVELVLADGTVVPVGGRDGGTVRVERGARRIVIDGDVPIGCHTLTIEVDGVDARAVCTVVRPPASMSQRAPWHGGSGLFVPAYALWDRDAPLPSFGLLARVASELRSVETALLTTLPLYATFLDEPFDPSPYAPASRLHWSEVFVDDAQLPAADIPLQGRYLDWAGVAARRREQLRAAADTLDASMAAAVDRFVADRPDVAAFARFMSTRPGAPVVDGDRGGARERRSHELAQYLADRQLGAVGSSGAGLAIDLPIGCHVEGYETWAHPELFAAGVTIGAPPDLFFVEGQDWSLPPQLPAAGRRSGHRLWRDLLTRAGEHAALLRIDHVMAAHRLWWIPAGFGADRGVYVRYPREELLAVIAATAAEVGTTVVGEDLGTVPTDVSEALARWEMLGMYEEQFHTDDDPIAPIPPRTVAGIRTHDMQPFAAFVAEQGPSLEPYRRRLSAALGREVGSAYGDLLDAVLERLATSASAMVTVDLDDLLGETEPHNVPGRIGDTTWRRRLDRPLGDVLADADVRRRLALLATRPRS